MADQEPPYGTTRPGLSPNDPQEPSTDRENPTERDVLPLSVGPYRVIERIGTGSFAHVYLARESEGRGPVALKVLHDHLDPAIADQVRARFLAEERITRRIGHPAIVHIQKTSLPHEQPAFIAMDYVQAVPFCQYFKERFASPSGLGQRSVEVARLGHQVAEAMARAHEYGIVHRDLKPDNVLVAGAEGEGGTRVRIIDFGIAKAPAELFSLPSDQIFTRYWTELGTIMGSPPYMAPEQNGAAQSVTGSADVYALGVMLLIALLDLDASALERGDEMLNLPRDLTTLLERRNSLDSRWNELLTRMLAPNPTARPPMDEVALTLQELARSDREFAAAVSTWKRTGRIPSETLLSELLARAQILAPLTGDEQTFLRQAPLVRLQGVRRTKRRLAVASGSLVIAVGAAALAAVQRGPFAATSTAKSTQTELALQTGAPPPNVAVPAPAPELTVTNDERDRLHMALKDARAEAQTLSTTREEQRRRLAEMSDSVDSWKQRALFAEKQIGDLKAAQQHAEEMTEKLNQQLATVKEQIGLEQERAALCDRQLDAQNEQLAATVDRLKLCNRLLDQAGSTEPSE